MDLLRSLALRVVWVLFCALVAAFSSQVVAELTEKVEQRGKTVGGHLATVKTMLEEPSGRDLWSEVGGYAAQIQQLKRGVVTPLRYPHLFFAEKAASLRPAQGVLLHGPPGTGKTSFVRACAAEAAVPMLCFNSAVLEQKWFGESPKILAAAFELAKARAPIIVFVDEIDSLGRRRSEMDMACTYTQKTELLRHMDGLAEGHQPVIVVACTNCPHALDPAIRRRFGTEIEIGRPHDADRLQILRAIVRDEHVAEATLKKICAESAGETGANLRERYRRACFRRLERASPTLLDAAQGPEDLVRRLGRLTLKDWGR